MTNLPKTDWYFPTKKHRPPPGLPLLTRQPGESLRDMYIRYGYIRPAPGASCAS